MKEGETVQDVSGKGPVMIVAEVGTKIVDIGNGKGNIRCKWWDSTERNFKEYYFMAKELRPYEQGPSARVGGHETI